MSRSGTFTFLVLLSSILFSFYSLAQAQSTGPPSFTLRSDIVNVQKLSNYWRISFVCQAHVGQCKIRYIFLPTDWTTDGQSIIVPMQDTKSIRVYALQANISSSTGDSALNDIQIDFENGGIRLKTTIISSSSIFEWRENQIPSISNITSPVQQNQKNISVNSNSTTAPQAQNKTQNTNQVGENSLQINEIIKSLPSMSKFESVIKNGDIAQIALTFQDIVEYNMSCANKLPYLNEAVRKVQNQLQNLKNFINSETMKLINANQTLNGLMIEQKTIQKQLNITGTKQQIERNLQALQFEKSRKFSDFFSFARIANIYKDRLTAAISIAGISYDELNSLHANVAEDKSRLSEIEDEIKKLVIEKTYISRRVEANQNKIRQVEASGGGVDSAKIDSLQAKYREYSEKSAYAERAYLDAQSEYEKLKTRYESLQQEISTLTKRLNQINAILQKSQNLVSNIPIQKAEARMNSLEKNLPKLKEEAKNCSELQGISSSNQIRTPISPTTVAPDIYELRRTSPFSQQISFYTADWIMKYGVPQPFRFSCTASFDVPSGYGEILSIKSSTIRVMNYDDKSQYDLHIGLCSRINAKTSFYVPKLGDVIDWQGYMQRAGVYNIYKANIYSV